MYNIYTIITQIPASMSVSSKCVAREHTLGYIATGGTTTMDEVCRMCEESSSHALKEAIKGDLERTKRTAMWEWFCPKTLQPMSPRADGCCCPGSLIDFLQEMVFDMVGEHSMYDEGMAMESGDSKGLPWHLFSLEILLMAASTFPLRVVLENRIRNSTYWVAGNEEECTQLVEGMAPGGTLVVTNWDKVTYYDAHDFVVRSGIPLPPFGLGFLQGDENSYLEHFSDNSSLPLTDETVAKCELATPTKEVFISPQTAAGTRMDVGDQDSMSGTRPPVGIALKEFVKEYVDETLSKIGIQPSVSLCQQFPVLQQRRSDSKGRSRGVKRAASVSLEREWRYPPVSPIFPQSGSGDKFHRGLTFKVIYSDEGFKEQFEAINIERKLTLIKVADVFCCYITLVHRFQDTSLAPHLKSLVPHQYSEVTTAKLRYRLAGHLSQTSSQFDRDDALYGALADSTKKDDKDAMEDESDTVNSAKPSKQVKSGPHKLTPRKFNPPAKPLASGNLTPKLSQQTNPQLPKDGASQIIRGFKQVVHCSEISGLNPNPSSDQTIEQQDPSDASQGALDARISLNRKKILALKAQSYEVREHQECVTQGANSGGFKCVDKFCQQNIPYKRKSFVCNGCGRDHGIFFRNQVKALRDQISALEDAIFKEGKDKIVPEKK